MIENYFHQHNIDKTIPIPLYYQLKEILLNYIKKVDAGTALPTEEQLCRLYKISRPTIRQAIRDLENSGLVERMKGKGTFICEKKIKQDFLAKFESFEEQMSRLNYTVRSEILEFSQLLSDENLSSVLQIGFEQPVYKVRKIKFANDIPMVLSLSYLPGKFFLDLRRELLDKNPISQIIRNKYNYLVDRYEKYLEVKTVSDYEASLLGVKHNAPVQYIETIGYMKDDIPLVYTMERYRSDRNKFRITMTFHN